VGVLKYSMITSLDGFVNDKDGDFGWSAPEREVHEFANEQSKAIGTYLYGRRMYEVMSYWETAHLEPGAPQYVLDFARTWQAADKIVFSTTLDEVTTQRTRLERSFDPEMVRRLKAESESTITVDGPTLASEVIRAGLVDEFELLVAPAIVGGGTPFFPLDVRFGLELLDTRRFGDGSVFLRYAVAEASAA
jgi:dihydrofolate reductase